MNLNPESEEASPGATASCGYGPLHNEEVRRLKRFSKQASSASFSDFPPVHLSDMHSKYFA